MFIDLLYVIDTQIYISIINISIYYWFIGIYLIN